MRIMKSNSITSLSKHADFLLLDEIALVVAFSFAYFFKFGNFGFIESPSWRGLLLCLALGDLLFTILTNPYSGIFPPILGGRSHSAGSCARELSYSLHALLSPQNG